LDELMHPATLYSPPDKQALEKEMAIRMAGIPSGDVEFLIEELCIFRQINYLRVAAADVSGNYPLMKVSDHLTYIAETVLAQVLASAWEIVTHKYGFPQGISDESLDHCGFAIIAYGKVGGLEMGYKSDIDIVFLHRGESGVTKGREKKSIDTIRFYSNMGQRIINALTMHTPAGTLYGADMRLRPGGNSGMIVSHIDTFEDYMKNQAWTWEHQALIRARPVSGDKKIQKQFNRIRETIITQKRNSKTLKTDVLDMRQRMKKEHLKTKKDFFDIKQGKGGIIDIEFLVQYLVLKNSYSHPGLILWTDNIRLLESLAKENIIQQKECDDLKEAYLVMRKAIHRLNLQEKNHMVSINHFSKLKNNVISIYNKYL
ncbi:MAG: bifunctional [glutamate--ammonia ligase]-adenylyl-L-tyrosine phosphorylase/[glutamate--ammonia-ligase] adenylyltransferase, partial [Desulfobacula sp.]|nr:bifunctional [glutamate--ammonia ligase]-adenylyl-L-tyrosine phosphorylase/[glutamate--ammonia-ligase] adenylyltransferase [Desulfobacula sp.]